MDTTLLPPTAELTTDDLDAMPNDGYRRELLDGALIVTPSLRFAHQDAQSQLFRVIDRVLPAGHVLFVAPFDVRIGMSTNLQPDLLVAPRSDFTEANLPVAPLLAVEILSPSTRHIDLGLKKSAYEALGTPSYWAVDPAVPSVIAWQLVDGEYVEAGRAEGDQELALQQPFPVRIVPAALVP